MRAAAPLDVVLPTLRARIEHVRDVLQDAVANRLAARGIEYLQGSARLGINRTVHITSPDGGQREVAARAVLVATGSRPTHPPGIPFDDPDVYDSDQIYSISAPPTTSSSSAADRSASSSPRSSPRSASPRRWSACPIGCCTAWTANWPNC